MIARISGRLQEMRGSTALVDTGAGLWCEVMVPATDAERLAARVRQDKLGGRLRDEQMLGRNGCRC